MNTHLVIPWREDAARLPILEYMTRHWWHQGFTVTLGITKPDEPWCKAAAVAAALESIDPNDRDILAVVDADVWTIHLGEAVEAVRREMPWARPNDRVVRLNERSTASILAGENPVTGFGPSGYEEPQYNAMRGGGVTVLRVGDYRRVPMDPRFIGWGHEDEAWGIALSTMYGEPFEVHEILWHLWHPPQERVDRYTGSPASVQLGRRYQMARGDPEMMGMVISQIV